MKFPLLLQITTETLFGHDPRICIGKSFALLEAVLILATIAQSYRLELFQIRKLSFSPQSPCVPNTVFRLC
ncbi:cytochrome P450 [Phormidium tenue FACHB-886]|nr:cytochrome P450 [Phormidium tenue FACHB-886]